MDSIIISEKIPVCIVKDGFDPIESPGIERPLLFSGFNGPTGWARSLIGFFIRWIFRK